MIVFLKNIIKFIIRKQRDYIYSLYRKRIFNLYNTNYDLNALISYQPASFLLPKWFYWFKNDSIYERNLIIAKTLKQEGFNVDVISNIDFSFSPKKEYNLIFDTDVLYKKIYFNQNKKPKVILHYTTSYYEFHNKQQLKRINNFNYKTGNNICIERPLETKNDGEFASEILSMGNEFTKSTFPKKIQHKISSIPNFPMGYLFKYKKHIITDLNKRNFLYMASDGAIFRGLDLLLDIFSRNDMKNFNLYVCGSFENDYKFMDYYSKYFELPNIYKIGWVKLFKKNFKNVIERCTFHIFPSCTEGMPGALMSTMAVGIIPICTVESGLNIEKDELIIKDNISDIVSKIKKITTMSLSDLDKLQSYVVNKSMSYKQKHIEILRKTILKVIDD